MTVKTGVEKVRPEQQIKMIAIWQGLLAAGGAFGAAYLFSRPPESMAGWLRIVLIIIFVLMGAASGDKRILLLRRQHRGVLLLSR